MINRSEPAAATRKKNDGYLAGSKNQGQYFGIFKHHTFPENRRNLETA
jgi:hypothetical protein